MWGRNLPEGPPNIIRHDAHPAECSQEEEIDHHRWKNSKNM